MKKLLLILSLLFCAPVLAWNQRAPLQLSQCQVHSPYGFPESNVAVQSICRQAYLVGYDAIEKIPRYVTYNLTPQHALGCVVRTNAFAADQSVSNGATPADYTRSGYDKGHVAPNGDLSWDTQVEFESFLMTNMVPQTPYTNRSIVKSAETLVRTWTAQLNQPFVVYGGPIFNLQDKTIGNGVKVPHAFFKIAINATTGQTVAWIFPNVSTGDGDITKLRASVAQIEQLSGIKFALPTNATELPAGKEWPADFGKLTQTKRSTCGTKTPIDQ